SKDLRTRLWAAFWVITWCLLNMTLVLSNKYMIRDLHFSYPILVILTGTFTTFIGCLFFTFVLKLSEFPYDALMQRKWILLMSAVFQAATYVLENISIVTLPISLNQIIKSTSPFFVVILMMAIYRTKYPLEVLAITLVIVGGAIMAVIDNPSFALTGFLYALASTLFAAVQTVIITSLLKDPKLNSLAILTVTSLPSTIVIIPLFFIIEYPKMREHPPADPLYPSLLVAALAIIALFYNLSHYYLVRYTSALYYALVCNAKIVVLIIISSFIFPTAPFTVVNYIGMSITLLAFFAYNIIKISRAQRQALQQQQQQQQQHQEQKFYNSPSSPSDTDVDEYNARSTRVFPIFGSSRQPKSLNDDVDQTTPLLKDDNDQED
ncbi:hypothetical protein SAMD00019534_060380, partial [Acytostelium subglobosum LB1]|uniref:hypothetical protein n=1 Tax=Acytostelium subglobosum LB1 TaxID=1410327 RepID=UPI000644FAD3